MISHRHTIFSSLGALVTTASGDLAQIVHADIIAAGHVMEVGVKYLTPWWMSPTLFFRKSRFYDDEIEGLTLR